MWKRILLVAWVLGILLPLAWFTRYSPLYLRAFNLLFGPLWTHIVTHALLFAALAYLAATSLGHRYWRQAPWAVAVGVLGLVLAAGLFQECIQLAYKARPIVADDFLDIGVDLTGGAAGLLVFVCRAHIRPRVPTPAP